MSVVLPALRLSRRSASSLSLLFASLLMHAACGAGGETVRVADDAGVDTTEDGSAALSPDTTEAVADGSSSVQPAEPTAVRFATWNVSMFRPTLGELLADLQTGTDPQATAAATVIAAQAPDVLLLNEFDYDAEGAALQAFVDLYLDPAFGGQSPYEFRWVAPSNTGVHSGLDLNGDGRLDTTPGSQDYGNDSLGFGVFEGQYGFAVLSRYPIVTDDIRTFQNLRWADMPDALLPDNAATPEPADFYSADALALFRLSSKNHADVPVRIGDQLVHLLASHPTPPAFDGPEDRNGRRNHDEIVFWTHYADNAGWITDDGGTAGGLQSDALFVVAGDLNNDPFDPADNLRGIQRLLDHPRVQSSPVPTSNGGPAAAEEQGQANADHQGPDLNDTADFSDGAVGNLRADYVLPSTGMEIVAASVVWPRTGEPFFDLISDEPFAVSDHRMVVVDLLVPAAAE